MTKHPTTYATSVVESVEALTVLIELSGTDITADYGDGGGVGGWGFGHDSGGVR